MLIKLICLLLGHRFVIKAFTGQIKRVHNAFRGDEDVQYYTYENKRFCLRCGAKNPAYKDEVLNEGMTRDYVKAQWPSPSPEKAPDGPRERLVGKRMKQGCEDITRADVRM